jgi:hypothetical protein
MGRLTWTDLSGMLLGVPLAGPAALGTKLRGSRLLHPRGVVLCGHARPIADEGALGELAARLTGPLVLRFSGALSWRGEGPDILGCAIRFLRDPCAALDPGPDDQDLLLATVRAPVLLPVALLTSDPHDFLANLYHGVSPFRAPGLPRLLVRLAPMPAHGVGHSREERLLDALSESPLALRLDVRPARPLARYTPLVSLTLHAPLAVDQRQLRFDPFRAGRGLTPTGLVHHLRVAVYAAAQRARTPAPPIEVEVEREVASDGPWAEP